MNAHIHTYIHTYMHTYPYIHVCIRVSFSCVSAIEMDATRLVLTFILATQVYVCYLLYQVSLRSEINAIDGLPLVNHEGRMFAVNLSQTDVTQRGDNTASGRLTDDHLIITKQQHIVKDESLGETYHTKSTKLPLQYVS